MSKEKREEAGISLFLRFFGLPTVGWIANQDRSKKTEQIGFRSKAIGTRFSCRLRREEKQHRN